MGKVFSPELRRLVEINWPSRWLRTPMAMLRQLEIHRVCLRWRASPSAPGPRRNDQLISCRALITAATLIAIGCQQGAGGGCNPVGTGASGTAGSGSVATAGTSSPVRDLGAQGPYAVATDQNTGPSNGYTIYRPTTLAQGGVPNPIVSWGNGGFTTPVDYPLLPHLASHGFVIIASNNPIVSGPEVRSGIDWILAQNDTASSPFYQKLDVAHVAAVGYSNGGLATYGAADHPALTTMVIISGGNTNASSRTENMPKVHTPTAYFCTDDSASEGNCRADYDVISTPAFFGVMNGSEHVSVTTFLGLGSPAILDRLNVATTGWLRWQLMGDESLATMFLGTACGLCTDPNWTVMPPKNWD